MPKLLHVIVACSENRVIGRGGRLPWRIPEDQQQFHTKTAGQICVLGRICFEGWPRATMDGRRPVVLASHPLPTRPADAHERSTPPVVASSLNDALVIAETLPGDIYICGGQRVYEEALALARPLRLHLTLIHASIEGDRYFPEWRHLAWREIARRESADASYRYTFLTLER